MTTIKLPAHAHADWSEGPLYTADQMHAHAAAVSAAERVQSLMWKDERDALQKDYFDAAIAVGTAAQEIAALRAELEEWRFTNKVDELERERDALRSLVLLLDSLLVDLDCGCIPAADRAEYRAAIKAALGSQP